MNWKNRYAKIKKGDMVKLIKLFTRCGNCCEQEGYHIGHIYEVTSISNMKNSEQPYKLNSKCNFPKDHIEKV